MTQFSSSMLENTSKLLAPEQNVIAVLDNNQRGIQKKFQRHGESSLFVKVTARYFKEYLPYRGVAEHMWSTIDIIYIDQAISSQDSMLFCEVLNTSGDSYYSSIKALFQVKNVASSLRPDIVLS